MSGQDITDESLEDYFGTGDSDCEEENTNRNFEKTESKRKTQQGNSVIYENKEMYSPQGELLGFIPLHRFNWYIKKGLCEILTQNSIKLNFEPTYENEKVIIDKETQGPKDNACVVCGTDQNLKKFRVVPYEIKKLFPASYKAHKSSDVVVACIEDAGDGDYFNKEFKQELYKRYGIDPNNYKIDSKMRSIFCTLEKIADDGYVCINIFTQKMLEEYFGKMPDKEEIDKFIQKVKDFKYEGFRRPEEALVNKVINDGKLDEFVQEWKQNFVNNMDPECLQWDFWRKDQ